MKISAMQLLLRWGLESSHMLDLVRHITISGTVADWPDAMSFLKSLSSSCPGLDRLEHPQTSSKFPELLLVGRHSGAGHGPRDVAASIFANRFDARDDGSPQVDRQVILIDGVACDPQVRGYQPSLTRDLFALAVCQIACCDFEFGESTAVVARIPSSAESLRFELSGLGAIVVPAPSADWNIPGPTAGMTFLSMEERAASRSAAIVGDFGRRPPAKRASREHRGGARLHVKLDLPWLTHMEADIAAMASGALKMEWSGSNLLSQRSIGRRLRSDDQQGGDEPS